MTGSSGRAQAEDQGLSNHFHFFYKCLFSGFQEMNRKENKSSDNEHHRMSVRPTTWSKKGQSVYCFSVFTPGSTSLILEVTAPASHDPGRDRHTHTAGLRVKGRWNTGLVAMNDLRCLLMSPANSDQYLYAMQEVHADPACSPNWPQHILPTRWKLSNSQTFGCHGH